MTVSYGNGTLPKGSSGGWGLLPADEARLSTLENIQYEYEVFTSIASGTSATIAFPAGSALVVGEYAGQNAIVTVLDASGRPIDQAAKTAAGAVITSTLNAGGTYTLSGTPSAYPVGLVYQLRCSAKDAGNIPLASIIDATQVEGTMAKQDANAVAITGGTASLSSLTLSSGTADGILYLNGSKAATSGSALRFDGTTFGLWESATGNNNRLLVAQNAGIATYNQTYSAASTNAHAWQIGGSEVSRLTLTGFGVGTNNPITKIDARGSSGLGIQFIETTTGNTNRIQLGATSGVSYINADAGVGTTALAFQVATSERMRLDLSGNLGIGNSSPVYKLVVSNAGAQGFEFDPATGITQVFNRNTSAYGEWLQYASQIRFFTGASPTEKIRIDASGNLGVGTNSPGNRLHVNGAGDVARFSNGTQNGYLALDSGGFSLLTGAAQTGNGIYASATTNNVQLFTNSTAKVTLDSTGNLGIGATPNTSKVVAAGVIESTSGGFKFPDGTTQTTAATGGGGGGVTVKTSTITVSSATYYQYTTSIVDATVSAASHINAWLAPNTDWDGDDLIGYDVILTPQSGTIDVCISAPGPIVGTFTLKYFVA